MGCSDSTAIDNHLSVRNQNAFKNVHQYPNQQNKQQPLPIYSQLKHTQSQYPNQKSTIYNQNSSDQFQNSQQYLEELYDFCQGNLQKFFSQLQQKISDIYMTISKDTLQQMNQNVLINNQSKIQISQEILWFNLNILKVASRQNQHKFNPTIFKQINKLQKNLVGYLKMKYPRGGQSFVPGDLMAVFKQFDLSEDIQFDILKNANIYFGSQNDADLSRDIKIFLNKIINQLDLNYPKFQKLMQQRVFLVQSQDGQKKTLNYKIGRKIPQNVSKYTDLDNNTLEINSPQIFRVIIKWMQYLQQTLTSPNENINKKKNFKCFIQQNEKGQNVYDQINQDQYYDLINYQLIQKIEKQKTLYHDSNQVLLKDMDRFNSHLIKLLDTSIRKQKFVPIRQMETIKYSNLNAKFIAWVLGQKLMLALKKLIKVGKSFYDTKSMLNLDLIQFKVSDLMRSMVSGSKKQILAVYSNLKQLEKQGIIKIIKIKNRLGTSLNDAMLIFAIKDTFLICQIQLILSDSTQKVNQKYKNIELLNHFFYQLQRSPYGILSQIAVLLAYKDSKVSYEDNITFEINKIDIQSCTKNHPDSVFEIKEQTKPFICTKCTKFYFKFQNIFLMKHCEACNIFVCAKCIFSTDKQLEKSIVNRQIASEVQRAVAKTLTKVRNVSSSTGASAILQLFQSPYKRLQELFGQKKVQISKLIDYLNNRAKNAQDDLYFVIVSFRTGRAVFKQLLFKPAWKQIQNPFNPRQQFLDKKSLSYTTYDLILFYVGISLSPQNLQKFPVIQDNMLHLYIQEQDLKNMNLYKNMGYDLVTVKLIDFRLVINVEKMVIKAVNNQNQDQRQDATWKSWKNKCTKTFKYASLDEATAGLPDLAGAKSILKLSDLGIMDVHLKFFKQINWVLSIKQLKLSKNNLTSVSVILDMCTNLQRLYINENYIKQLTFTKQLKLIDIINAVNNQIAVIEHCDKIRNISKLLLEGNRIEDFPKAQFPNLKIINLKRNPIKDFSNVYNSVLPNVQQMFLDYEQIDEATASRPNDEVDLDNVVLPFEKLRSIQSESNFVSITIESKKIQRINFYRNTLKNITLSTLQSLKYLILSYNSIQNIDFLFGIKYNYENNVICEIDLRTNSIRQLPIMRSTSLIKANFESNQISNIANLSSSNLPNLIDINFAGNLISQIPQININKLKVMNLSNNPISKMNSLSTSKLQSLQSLQFSGCGHIQQFPLLSLPKLTEISFMSTQLQSMHNLTTSNLPLLKKLSLILCTIDDFPILSLNSLQHLDLSNSYVKNLYNLQKSKLNNLKFLQLAYVQIEHEQQPQNQVNDAIIAQNNVGITKQQANKEKVNKFACNFNFPKLQLLRLDGANFKNMIGLQNDTLPCLQQLSIQVCIFNKYPKLRLKNLKKIHAGTCQITTFQSLLTPQLVSLQQLHLSGNLIQKVSLNLSKIKKVDLSVNKINQFIQIGELNELQYLNLQYNSLTVFPLLRANKLKKLQISGNQLNDISKLGQCKLDQLQQLRISNCLLSESLFPIINLPSVKSFYIQQCSLKDISNLQLSTMGLVQDINLSDNGISIMPRLRFPQLKFLRMNRNKISDINNLSKSQCPQLTIIQLETNQIKSLPKLPFPNLTKIFMHENQCTNVSQFNQSQIKNFVILNICSNSQLIQWPILKSRFEQLYANQTKLTDIIRLNEYKGLKKIQLNGNNISYLPKLNQRQLQMIQFQDNLLTQIQQFSKGQYPQCTQFAIKGNQIIKIPKLNMIKLKKCYFNSNLLTDIDLFLQSNTPDIQLITVQNNKINKISKLPYPNLKDIYLTGNRQLEQLTCFTLPQYNHLTMIVAASTGIKKVQPLPKMPKLQKIWVSDSKLTDIQWLSASANNIPKLQFFNGSNNGIKSLPRLNFIALNQLYMNGNPIQNMDRFLGMQEKYISNIYTCNICIKTKSEQQFNAKCVQIQGKWPYVRLSRYLQQ